MKIAPSADDLVKLSYFADMAKKITSAYTVKDTLVAVQHHIGAIFSPQNWSIMLTEPETGRLRFQEVTGEGADQLKGQVLARGTGIAGWIAEHALPLIVEDVTTDDRFDPSMDELTGFTTKSIIGVPLINRGRVFGVIELVNKPDGTSFSPMELKILVTIAEFGAIAIEKAYYTAALKRVAMTDPLTGALNRRGMEKSLEREVSRCKRINTLITILMFDVDNFKEINDTYGHIQGDEVLKELADILKKNIRKADIICRYGGDEFAVIMPDAGYKKAEHVKNRILAHLAIENDRREFSFGVSIGIHSGEPDTVADIFDFADKALYFEKTRKIEMDIDNLSTNLPEFL
ncbi:sensor domain-containing diguanylate cyclase [Marispirochaeta sp.]|jgi:diguanylate cyclase (GGDEF)-like protein|uniref:GGDEF domain-containing protein n=1 Tax=Marispirochaeta sp. TaxID=2038653 RepID=UPI0029C9AEBF|nr:sensor domain-containing diguanylate cyclase [Marispirochaeta sp.]